MSRKLSLTQRILRWWVSDQKFDQFRSESKRWKSRCRKCNQPNTYWSVGGAVRKGSLLNGPMTIEQGGFYRCPQCKKWSQMKFARSP